MAEAAKRDNASQEAGAELPLLIGRVCMTLDPETSAFMWSFHEYDPEDRETFPLELALTQGGKPYQSPTSGKVYKLETGDSLTLYFDLAYRHMMGRGIVKLRSLSKEEVCGTTKPRTFLVGNTEVASLPTNVDPQKWLDCFFDETPAALIRYSTLPRKDDQPKPG